MKMSWFGGQYAICPTWWVKTGSTSPVSTRGSGPGFPPAEQVSHRDGDREQGHQVPGGRVVLECGGGLLVPDDQPDPHGLLLLGCCAGPADTTVALLRTEAGRDPHNRALTDLVGELATRSDAFRTRWAAHDVRLHHAGVQRFRHPVVGDLTVGFNALELPTDPGLTLTVYTAEPGSPSDEKLALLASWTATAAEAQPDAAADRA
jgi:hypothetical protein